MSQLPSMTYGLFSYLVLCVSAVVGYYFARKRTEYEVRYRHRVEVAEGVQGMVTPLVEEFEAAWSTRAPARRESCPSKRSNAPWTAWKSTSRSRRCGWRADPPPPSQTLS